MLVEENHSHRSHRSRRTKVHQVGSVASAADGQEEGWEVDDCCRVDE